MELIYKKNELFVMNKYIKTFENFTIDKYLNLKLYYVEYWKDNSNISIYYGTDYNEAKNEFDSFDTNDIDSDVRGEYYRSDDSYNIAVVFNEKINEYKWIGDEDDNIEDYPINEYYDDESYYELVKEGEYEVIDSKNVETPESVNNREEKELEQNIKNEVINYIKSITHENKYAAFLNSTFYALKQYKDGFIMLRVADHFFNIDNVNLGKDVLYDYLEGLPEYNKYKNIYGFISINILNKDSSDRKGFRRDFREWKEDNPDLSSLVDYIDWKEQLENSIEYMEDNIDNVLNNGVFDDND